MFLQHRSGPPLSWVFLFLCPCLKVPDSSSFHFPITYIFSVLVLLLGSQIASCSPLTVQKDSTPWIPYRKHKSWMSSSIVAETEESQPYIPFRFLASYRNCLCIAHIIAGRQAEKIGTSSRFCFLDRSMWCSQNSAATGLIDEEWLFCLNHFSGFGKSGFPIMVS